MVQSLPVLALMDRSQATGATLEEMRAPLIGYFRRRVRQQDDVQDLVQDVLLRVSARGGLADVENPHGYVFQVAASVLVDRQRRRAVRHHDAHIEFDLDRVEDTDLGPQRILLGKEALQTVLAALDTLPDRTRNIFVLRRLEGMRYRDIADRLGLSVSAVEKHMVRAIACLAAIGISRD